jgi:hydrogenase maturation factor
MCRSTLALVLNVSDGWADIEMDGQTRRATTLLIPDLRPGERVLVGLGTVLARVDEADAAALRALQDGLPATPSSAVGRPDRRS